MRPQSTTHSLPTPRTPARPARPRPALGPRVLAGLLVAAACGGEPALAPSAPPGSILFHRSDGTSSHVYAMRQDGSGVVELTRGRTSDYCARWSPDGRRVLFLREADTVVAGRGLVQTRRLFLMNADGSGATAITDFRVLSGCGSWAPDGRRIAFDRLDPAGAGGYRPFTMNADGTGAAPLLPAGGPAESARPQWLPDGRTLAVSAGFGTWGLFLVDADGSNVRPVGGRLCALNAPGFAVSPDGRRVAFWCPGGATRVAVMGIDGSGLRQLGAPPELIDADADAFPVWSPDGARLALARSAGPNMAAASNVFVLDLESGTAARLTSAPGRAWPTDWR